MKKIDDIFWPMGNVEEILMELYDCLSLKVTKRTIHEELLSHPNNSSLLAISDILGGENQSMQIDENKKI